MNANEILLIFCQYGFRKASMEDIARAAGLSRQSVYKKFGSKEGVFDWVIHEAIEQAFEKASKALNDTSEVPVTVRLARALDRWYGDFVPFLHGTPHGQQLLDKAVELTRCANRKGEDEMYRAIEQIMLDHGLAENREQAADKTFALALMAKGLLHRVETQEAFRQGMERAIRAMSLDERK